VIKEEIRIRKSTVEEEEIVEVNVRKEEIDIDDQATTRRDDRG
jgi:stress response protein YsnF